MTASRFPSIAAAVAVAVCAAALYVHELGNVPPWRFDDAMSGLNGESLASTGRDLNGRAFPLIFYPGDGGISWFAPPLLVYAIAATLTFAPVSETTIRLPTVVFGVVDIVLIYAIGTVLFRRVSLAAGAALLVALSPAHFIHARYGMPVQISLPFILGWLLCLLRYLKNGDRRLLVAAGGLLFLAGCSYFATLTLLPIYVLLTWYVLRLKGAPRSAVVAALAGVAIPALLCVPWVLMHPAAVGGFVGLYQWASLSASATGEQPGMLARAASVAVNYARFWDPRFLFVESSTRAEFSTGIAGVFLFPMAGLIIAGIAAAIRQRSPEAILVLVGFLSAPLPASLTGEAHAVWRTLTVVPFGALLAVWGLASADDATALRRLAILFTFGVVIYVAATNHTRLPASQAMVRAAIMPMVIVGVAKLLSELVLDPRKLIANGIAWLGILVIVHAVFTQVDERTIVLLSSLTVIAAGAAWLAPQTSASRAASHPITAGAVLALLASAFVFLHVERPITFVHPRAQLAAMRFGACTLALVAAVLLASIPARLREHKRGRLTIVGGIAAVQIAYFYVDLPSTIAGHYVLASLVLLAATVAAMFLPRAEIGPHPYAAVFAAGLLTIASLQFGYFYADYFTTYASRMAASDLPAAAWDSVIDHAVATSAPVIYVPRRHHGDESFWRFYLAKHRHAELAARTASTSADRLGPDDIGRLPSRSVIMTPAGYYPMDQAIKRLLADDAVRDVAPSAGPARRFWLLERPAFVADPSNPARQKDQSD